MVHAKELCVALRDDEKYIRTEELLALQKPSDALSGHDALQFQVAHQAHELHMKLSEHELRCTGKHNDVLLHGMKQRFFPELGDKRDHVFGAWTAAHAAKGHDPGYHR